MTRFVRFASTVWNLVHSAREDAKGGLDALVVMYRPPIVRYLRSRGAGDQAEDLAQEVFLRIFQKDLLQKVDRSRGRFRSFLLGVANNVLRETRERDRAQKRGADASHVPLPQSDAPAPAQEENAFTREWMLHLVRLATERLAGSPTAAVRRDLLIFRGYAARRVPYEGLASEFGVTVTAVKNAIYETKQRIRREVAALVNTYALSREDFRDELALFDSHTSAPPATL